MAKTTKGTARFGRGQQRGKFRNHLEIKCDEGHLLLEGNDEFVVREMKVLLSDSTSIACEMMTELYESLSPDQKLRFAKIFKANPPVWPDFIDVDHP